MLKVLKVLLLDFLSFFLYKDASEFGISSCMVLAAPDKSPLNGVGLQQSLWISVVLRTGKAGTRAK